MRMMDSAHQQLPTAAAYRVVNERTANVVVETLPPENISDDDDDDTELMGDGDINFRPNNGDGTASPHSRMENDKRLRREIANSNERRRMQSINAGFQSLKALLPRRDGEKMSKASILQQTADFIRSLQSDKDLLLQQSNEMKQQLDGGVMKPNRQVLTTSCIPKIETSPLEKRHCGAFGVTAMDMIVAPPKKRRKFDNDSADEGLGMLSDAEAMTAPRISPGNGPFLPAMATAVAFTQTDPPCATVEAASCTTPFSPPQLGESKNIESSIVQDKLWEIEMLQRQLIELRLALDRERRVRLMLEEQMRLVELNRLQTLARLQSAPLLDYNIPQTLASSTVIYPSAVSSPMIVVKSSSPALLRPPSATPANNYAAANHSATVTTISATPLISVATALEQSTPLVSLNSLPDPVSSRPIPLASSQPPTALAPAATGCDVLSLPTFATGDIGTCHRPALSLSRSPPPPSISKQSGQSNASNNAPLYQSHSSKQSLAAIVEAIRHLEGDQLFVDVELQRPVAQQQSMTSAVVSTTTGGPAIITNQCQSAVIGATMRPDYTDSGISSPVSERHVFSSSMANFATAGGQNIGPMLASVPNEPNVGSELNHVVAATAAALHNLCFPYTTSHLCASSASRHPQQIQQQGRHQPAGWSSASLQ